MSDRGAHMSAPEEAAPLPGETAEHATAGEVVAADVIEAELSQVASAAGQEELEHKDAKVAEKGGSEPEVADVQGDLSTNPAGTDERERLAERIRQSEALPVGLRTRLAELVLAKDSAQAERAVRAVEESLPGVLRLAGSDVARPPHPAGEVFFGGDEHSLSEEQAESIARGQLARSGMLRGQRVRVAD